MKSKFLKKEPQTLEGHDWSKTDTWMTTRNTLSKKSSEYDTVHSFLAAERMWNPESYTFLSLRALIQRWYGSSHERYSGGERGKNLADIKIEALADKVGMPIDKWEKLPGMTLELVIATCKELHI